MNRDYLSDPNYNYETVNRASKACGPLVKWAIAQVSYMYMYTRVLLVYSQGADQDRNVCQVRFNESCNTAVTIGLLA